MSAGSDLRPQLSAAEAAAYEAASVLRYTGTAGAERDDPWNPLEAGIRPDRDGDTVLLRVDPAQSDGETVFPTILGAVSRAAWLAEAGQARHVTIEICPGVYREVVLIPRMTCWGRTVPLVLRGLDPDPSHTRLEADLDQSLTGRDFARRFAAGFADTHPSLAEYLQTLAARDTLTTANACVLRIRADDVRIESLSVRNLYHETRLKAFADGDRVAAGRAHLASRNHQAVALMLDGADRVHARNLRLLAHQDTLYLRAPGPFETARSCFESCLIEGDVDFIFGGATAFFSGCEIRSLGSRTVHSYVAAPSTHIRTRYGFVFEGCDFTHDDSPAARRGRFNLGRQWFEGVRCTPYGRPSLAGYACRLGDHSAYTPPAGTISRKTLEAVGKAVVLRSRIGAHINPAAPWADWNGGEYAPDGTYTRGGWSPRFRPFQSRAADFLNELSDWLPGQGLDYADIDPEMTFLGEYANESIGPA